MAEAFSETLLAGKRILITGGGSGLGGAMAARFAALGAALAICGRRRDVLAETARTITAAHGTPVACEICDVRDADAVETMIARLWESGPIDALVNNAAGNFIAQTHKLSPRAIDAVLGSVLHGSAYCTVACGRRWIETGRPGTVLAILTLSALQGAAFTVPSAMAKAGVAAMIKSLAVEWGPHGIRLVGIAPGSFPTEGASARLSPGGTASDPPAASVPLGRDGRHAELANLAAFLLSDLAAYITGEIVVIDGGRRYLGGARAGVRHLLGWSEADWQLARAAMPGRG